MKIKFLLILLLSSSLFALTFEEILQQANPNLNTGAPTANQYKLKDGSNIELSDEADLDLDNVSLNQTAKPNDMLLSVLKIPRSIYINQVFPVTLKVNTQSNLNFDFEIHVEANENFRFIDKNILWQKVANGIYETTLYFEAKKENIVFKSITVTTKRNGEFYQKATLIPQFFPKIITLKTDKDYSHIVANSLKIKKAKTTKYDDEHNILSLELEVRNGDLDAFYINNPNIIKQNISDTSGNFARESAFYFAVLKNDVEELKFNFFNIKDKKFENLDVKIEVEADEVSTQVGLNPKESDIKIYKDIIIYSLILLSVAIFILRRKFDWLIFAVLLGIYAIYDASAYKTGILKAQAHLRILPTSNSTTFFITEKDEKVEIIGSRDKYRKIIFEDKIGWVDKDELKKDKGEK